MSPYDAVCSLALVCVCHAIDARAATAQESGKRLAEHHRRALGQRWRRVERELTRRDG